MVAGNTMSGKSYLCRNLIRYRDKVFNVVFKHIMYCTPFSNLKGGFLDSLKEIFPDIVMCHGLPDLEKEHWIEDDDPKLIIIDDLIFDVIIIIF